MPCGAVALVQDTARRGDVALHCAELLNKWAAASPEYSKDLVMRAAEYSVRLPRAVRRGILGPLT